MGKKNVRDGIPGPGASAEELARWVEHVVFSTTRFRTGYDEQDVDRFLDAIRDTFLGTTSSPVTADLVNTTVFHTSRLRPGYDQRDVDWFLDEVAPKLSGRGAAAT